MREAWIGVVAVVVASLGGSVPAVAAGARFDGQWSVAMTCPNSGSSTTYSWNFNVSIQGSVLHGQHGSPGQPNYMTLDGKLQDDGSAVLTARGLTGNPNYTAGRVAEMTPFVYHVDAMFGATSGQGKRIETRPCNFTFSKS